MSDSPPLTRILLDSLPFAGRCAQHPWEGRGSWRACWISCREQPVPPFVSAYRLQFDLSVARPVRLHVSADERYELFLDGQRIGRGPERGDENHWFFETYEGTLRAGPHLLVARVWSLGLGGAPRAQVSTRPGFLLAADDSALSALLDTGWGRWEACRLRGYDFRPPFSGWGTGARVDIDGPSFPWNFERNVDQPWPVAVIEHAANDDGCGCAMTADPVLLPAQLPPQLHRAVAIGRIRHVATAPSGALSQHAVRSEDHLPIEAQRWQALIEGRSSVMIPSHSRSRVIFDLETYCCAYHELTVSGGRGGTVEIHWAESLFEIADGLAKGNRDVVQNKFYTTPWRMRDGIGDRFRLDGGRSRRFEPLWWQSGRFLQLVIVTADEPLIIDRIRLLETRYPFERTARVVTSDSRLNAIIPLAWRTLQACAHETYVDCPFFEQLQYAGDTRLEALVTYVSTLDARLARKAIQAFDWSRTDFGLTRSNYPSNVRQTIPGFSLLWIGMVHDYFLWRNDPTCVANRLPGVRSVLDVWLRHLAPSGEISGLPGWNYLDWVPAWPDGIPPGGKTGGGASFLFLLVLALTQAAELEDHLGEPEFASRWRRSAGRLRDTAYDLFWSEERHLYSDTREGTSFSEHAQSLAVLADAVRPRDRGHFTHALLTDSRLTRTTIYFTHYLFEAFSRLGQPDRLVDRLDLWSQLRDRGLKTTIEMPEPTRSDCHAWSAHPLFHFHATLMGVRPLQPGFTAVRIAPQLGPLTSIEGTVPHPLGEISVSVRTDGERWQSRIGLPAGLAGEFCVGDETFFLRPGVQLIECSCPQRTVEASS